MRGAGLPELCKIGLHDPSQRVKPFLVPHLGFDMLCLDCGPRQGRHGRSRVVAAPRS